MAGHEQMSPIFNLTTQTLQTNANQSLQGCGKPFVPFPALLSPAIIFMP